MADPAVFLDRDGTLIEEIGFASRPEQIRILGGVAQALRELADAGYRLIVVTNQSGIARGFLTEEDLERFHDALDRQLHLLGAAVDAYYACPHHPDPGGMARPDLAVECECRKPKPGLILRAAEDFGVDLKASWTVGDTWRDVAAGAAAGTRTVKLPADEAHRAPRPAHVAPPTAEARSLAEATRIILGRQAPTLEETAAVAAREDEEQDDGLGPVEEPAESVEAEGDAPEDREGIATEDEPLQPPDALRRGEVKDHDEIAERVETEDRAPGASLPDTATAGGEAAEPLVTGVESEAEPPSALAAETPASSADGQCARCGRDIESDEIAAGAAGRRDGFLLCPECLAQQPREPGAGPDASTEDLLRLVLAELQRLRRAQRPSSLSSFRLLAYVVQAAALFFGFGMAVLGDERDLYLQIALLLQLLVLALLLFERRS